MMNKFKLATWGVTKETGQWVLWYLPILTVIMLIIVVFAEDVTTRETTFLDMVVTSNRVFMLVVGILSIFLNFEWLFKNGVTRKVYVKVMTVSLLLITLFLNALTVIISYILVMIPWFEGLTGEVTAAQVMMSVVVTFSGGILGSVIGAGFYRSTKTGFLTIILGLLMFGVEILSNMYQWEGSMMHWLSLLVLIAAALVLNDKLTRRVPVKL